MKKIFILPLCLVLFACYSPERYEGNASSSKSESNLSDFGTLFDVNGGHQICNPSVTQDEKNFPASMLWLNFSGTLNVNGSKEFSAKNAGEHDRLTVSDTAGNVLWFLMKDSVPGVECEFQDPEWATDGRFVVALGGFNAKGSKGCDDIEYGIFAVRLADNATLFLVDSSMRENADPHLWVGSAESAIDSTDSVAAFFGTSAVKLVYSDAKGLAYVDYSKGKKPARLSVPDSVLEGELGNLMISPDGNFVAFHSLASSFEWASYVQELSESSSPVAVEKLDGMLSSPVFPRWWKYGDRLFLVWAEFASGNSYLNKNDLLDESTWDLSVGRTAMREVSLSASAPRDLAVEWNGSVREIAPVPLIGGRSPSGHLMATGTNNGYLLYIP